MTAKPVGNVYRLTVDLPTDASPGYVDQLTDVIMNWLGDNPTGNAWDPVVSTTLRYDSDYDYDEDQL